MPRTAGLPVPPRSTVLVITGAVATGKSAMATQLSGAVPGATFLDGDVSRFRNVDGPSESGGTTRVGSSIPQVRVRRRMRLWLSSYRQGDRVELLCSLVEGDHAERVGLVANALDGDTQHDVVVEREADAFRDLGFRVDRIDLRDYQSGGDALIARLRTVGLLWVTGGNVFVLARTMHRCGFGPAIRALLDEDAVVYGGYSAGACIAGPDLEGLEALDDPAFLPEGYRPATPAPGLGLVPFRIVPHHDSDHPEREAAARAVEVMQRRRLTHQPLRDGQAVMIDGDSTAIIV